jgi:hypothetical protein
MNHARGSGVVCGHLLRSAISPRVDLRHSLACRGSLRWRLVMLFGRERSGPAVALFVLGVLLAACGAVTACGGLNSTQSKASPASGNTAASSTATTSSTANVPSTSTTSTSTVDFPGFLPTPGWETVKTPETFSATAANVALGPGTLSGDMPWDTVERLEDGDVVLFAMFIAPRESWGDDVFPPRSLPLSLDDTVTDINYNFEGQPDHIYTDRVGARVNGWAIDLLVFYGGGDPTAVPPVRAQPSAETRAAAQKQLARLVVPARELTQGAR